MASPLTISKSNSNGGRANSDIQQRLELEAQLSSPGGGSSDIHNGESSGGNGRFSIDYSLELERELAMESPPQTPMRATATSPAMERQTSQSSRSVFSDAGSVESTPDPEVLAHIITQLRHSLAYMTKEKDDLVKLLATANTEEANAKDALQVMTDKATEAEEALVELKRKAREDEEQITMLRAKVEESRRGLMRLQTENRRASMAPIDIARATAGGGLAAFGTTPSAKRASFVPLTGSGKPGGHRRSPSVNDAGSAVMSTPEVRAANIASAEAALSGAASSNSRRVSGFFGRQSPDNLSDVALDASSSNSAIELEAVRKELQAAKDQVDTLKHELNEATEAKEASETCVKALREFIAENNVGVNPPPPPPPPAMISAEDSKKSSGGGWGFKLWGSAPPVEANASRSSTSSAPAPPVSSAPSIASSTSMSSPVSASAAAPLSRKLTGFFGAKATTSTASQEQVLSPAPQPLHLQTNAAKMQLPSQRDSIYSHSDVSSVVEPISPTSDIHGLGTAPYHSKIQESDEDDDAADAVDEIPLKDALDLDAGSNPVHVSISASDMQRLR